MPISRIKGKNRFLFVLQHLVFWLISIVLFTVVLFYTRGDFHFYSIDLRLASSILITMIFLSISVYINLLWLIPTFFNKRKYLLFFLLEIANILLFVVLNFYVTLFYEGGRHPENFLAEFVAEFILVLIFLVVSTLLKFMRDSITLQDIELKIKEVEKQKVEAELRALKSQVNPHFFFNTLNSLYALTLEKSDKAPEMILKLSELMRYVIYESRDDLVPVGRQLDFLKSYVFLEQLRSDESLEVKFEVSGNHPEVSIAPLIYLAFIENAFKHGAKTSADKPYIHIHFNIEEENQVVFAIENRVDPYKERQSGGGFGLANVRKRLDLLYPGKHILKIEEKGDIFRVGLTIFGVMTIRCLIIDDEPLAQRIVERYAADISFLEIMKKCSNAIEAIEVLHNQEIDLIFLDINMPRLSGMEFLKTLKHPPLVIITTAYAEYAIQGYELDVVDYLMKPFSFERFFRAVQKASELIKGQELRHQDQREQDKPDETFIFIKSNKKTYKVNLNDILYIEALGDYVKIYTTDRMIISYQSMKNIEALLPSASFPRVHKSFVIALSRIDLIEGNQVKIRDRMIPVGTNFKAEFDRLIRSI